MEDRRCGRAREPLVRGRLARHSLPAQGHGHELVAGGQENARGLVPGGLQDRSGDVVLAQVSHLPVGSDEAVASLVVDDGLIADRGDREGTRPLESLDRGGLGAPRLALLFHRHQRGGIGRVGEDLARAGHGHDGVAEVLGCGVLAREGHRRGFVGLASPQGPLVGVEHRQDGSSLDLDRFLGQRHRLPDGEGGRPHGGDRARHGLSERHVPSGLADVEGRGLDGDGAVQHEGVVVEVAHELAVLVRHPDAPVVDAHLGDLDAAVDDSEHAQHRRHHENGDGRDPLRPGVSRLTRLLHVDSSVSMCVVSGRIGTPGRVRAHPKDTHRPTLWINPGKDKKTVPTRAAPSRFFRGGAHAGALART